MKTNEKHTERERKAMAAIVERLERVQKALLEDLGHEHDECNHEAGHCEHSAAFEMLATMIRSVKEEL